jgi:hypothetical protein
LERRYGRSAIGLLVMAVGAGGPLAVGVIGALPGAARAAGRMGGAWPGLALDLAATLAVGLVPALAAGAVLALASAGHPGNSNIFNALASASLGAAAGVVAAAPGPGLMGPEVAALVFGLATTLAGLASLRREPGKIAPGLAIAVAAGAWLAPRWDRAELTAGTPRWVRHGRDALLSLHASASGGVELRADGGALTGSRRTAAMLGHLGALLPREPWPRVLILGSADPQTLAAIEEHPLIASIEVVDPEPLAVAARRDLDPAAARALADPRVRVIHADPAAFVEATHDPYGLIVWNLAEPWRHGRGALFTTETLRRVGFRLQAQGLAAIVVPNTRVDALDLRALVATITVTFPSVSVWYDGESVESLLVMAAPRPLVIDAPLVARRVDLLRDELAPFGIGNVWDVLALSLSSDRDLRRWIGEVPIGSEDFPQLELGLLAHRSGDDGGAAERVHTLLDGVQHIAPRVDGIDAREVDRGMMRVLRGVPMRAFQAERLANGGAR